MAYDYFGPHQIYNPTGEITTTGKMCPFSPMQILDADVSGNETIIGMHCIGELCQLFIPNNDHSSDPFRNISNDLDIDFPTVNNPDGGRCGLQSSDTNELMYKLLHHIHASHYHVNPHNGPETLPEPDVGLPSVTSNVMGVAGLLIQEYLNNEDLDGNSKVYNYDFEIEEDSNKPPILFSIDNNKPNRSDVLIPWEQYLQGKIPAQILNVYPNYGNNGGVFYIKVSGHFMVDDSGMSGDFKVYVDGDLLPDNEYLIADEATLFIKIVAGSYPDDTIDFAIQNRGDTFSTNINTGGYLRTFERVFTFGTAATDTEAQDEVEDQIRDANGGNLF